MPAKQSCTNISAAVAVVVVAAAAVVAVGFTRLALLLLPPLSPLALQVFAL